MRRKEGQGEAHVFNHRTFERKLTRPLCLCPSLIHILNLSEVTAPQKWHLKLRPGTVCRAAGSSWDRIPPLVLHAASVTQVCPPFCLNLLSEKDRGLLEPPGPWLIWDGEGLRSFSVLLWVTGMGEYVGHPHWCGGRPVGTQRDSSRRCGSSGTAP